MVLTDLPILYVLENRNQDDFPFVKENKVESWMDYQSSLKPGNNINSVYKQISSGELGWSSYVYIVNKINDLIIWCKY